MRDTKYEPKRIKLVWVAGVKGLIFNIILIIRLLMAAQPLPFSTAVNLHISPYPRLHIRTTLPSP